MMDIHILDEDPCACHYSDCLDVNKVSFRYRCELISFVMAGLLLTLLNDRSLC